MQIKDLERFIADEIIGDEGAARSICNALRVAGYAPTSRGRAIADLDVQHIGAIVSGVAAYMCGVRLSHLVGWMASNPAEASMVIKAIGGCEAYRMSRQFAGGAVSAEISGRVLMKLRELP